MQVPEEEEDSQARLELRCQYGQPQSMISKVHRSPQQAQKARKAGPPPAAPAAPAAVLVGIQSRPKLCTARLSL